MKFFQVVGGKGPDVDVRHVATIAPAHISQPLAETSLQRPFPIEDESIVPVVVMKALFAYRSASASDSRLTD